MKHLALLAVVLIAFAIAPSSALSTQSGRRLLNHGKSSAVSDHDTLRFLRHSSLHNLRDTTIFAVDNKDWEIMAKLLNITGGACDLLKLLEKDASLQPPFVEAFSNFIIKGTVKKEDLKHTNKFTTLAGSTLEIRKKGKHFVGSFPKGLSCCHQDDNATFTIVNFDDHWKSNIVHTVGGFNGVHTVNFKKS